MKYLFLSFFLLISLSTIEGQIGNFDTLQISNLYDSLQQEPANEDVLAGMQRIEKLSKNINYTSGEILSKKWQGNFFRRNGQYEKSLQCYQEIISKIEKSASHDYLGIFNDLANVYNDLKQREKAIEYITRHLQISIQNQDTINLCLGRNTYGVILLKQGKPELALEQFLLAKKNATKANEQDLPFGFVSALNSNIAIIYVQTGKPEFAIQNFKEVLQFKKNEKDTAAFAPAYGNIAYAYQNLKQFKTALSYYDSSLYFSEKLEQDEITFVTYLDMADGYKMNDDFENALRFQKKYHDLQEQVIGKKTKKNIAVLEVKYETQRKEKELLATQKEVIELEQLAQIRKQRIGIIGGGLMASILVSFLIFFKLRDDANKKEIVKKLIRSKLKNKELEANQLQSNLTNKKSDLTNLALDIGRKNEFSNQLIDQLEKLKKVKPTELKSKLRAVSTFAINHLQINEDLALLQNNVDTVNQAFYKNLENQFGKLTANEKYLAGLIRLNLSNKEVAAIRGISTSSAKMSRHRLRKKLGLASEVDIVGFLQSI